MNIPDHKLISKIGEGAYGEIWLASNVTGVYRAIKIIHRDRFEHDRPYEREFNGIQNYEPVSREHGSLIQVLHVGRDEKKGYFYYIMELADDQHPGQEIDPRTYKPKTLRSELTTRENLPIKECLEQGAHIARALAHMHLRGLVHRDVKPANIVYVNGVPKLADIGLVKALDDSVSFAGTIGYVPLEGPGRPSGDVFSLGKVLYEMVTGMDRTEFPELPESFKDDSRPGLAKLNQVIFKACEHKPEKRYQKADDLAADLEKLIGQDFTTARPSAGVSLQPMKWVAALAVIAALIVAFINFKGTDTTPHKEPGAGGRETALKEDKYAHLKKGLVAYYPFNGNNKDESGNGYDGQVAGSAFLTQDRHGKKDSAYSFDTSDNPDGITDHIIIRDSGSLSFPEGGLTLSAWVNTKGFAGQIVTKGNGGYDNIDWNLSMGEGNIHYAWTEKLNEKSKKHRYVEVAADSYIQNKWQHIVVTHQSGSEINIYVDGVVVHESIVPAGRAAWGDSIRIGANHPWGSCIGEIDDVRLYNRSLSKKEVKDLHEMEKSGDTIASTSPKATKPKTFNLTDLVEKNGIYHHKGTGKPVTGKVFEERETDRVEFTLKDGLKHGLYQREHKVGNNGSGYFPLPKGKEWPAEVSTYQMGVLVTHRRWWNYDPKASPQTGRIAWEGTSSPWQLKLADWNKDGTPVTPVTSLNKGLVAYYPFNGNAKDESGNGNHAKNKGTLPAEDRHGVKGKAMSIGDANKDAVVNLGKVMAGKTTYSISIWFRTDDANGGVLLTTAKLYTRGAISFWVTDWFAEWGYYVSGNYLAVGTRNKGQEMNNRYKKAWDHVVLTVADEGKEKISFYLNGRLVTKGGPDLELTKILNEDLLLGNHPPGGKDEHFPGSFDDLRLYDRALSSKEVAELHEMEKPKSSLEKGLVAYYPFNGNAKDESGNGNDGKVNDVGVIVDGKAQFDGSNYITAKATRLPQGKSARTLSFWAVSTDPDMEWGTMVGWGDPDTNASFGSYIGSGHFGFFGWGTETADVEVSPSDEQVHHHCVTHNGDMISYYIDGKQIRTFKVGPRVTGGTVLVIGARTDEEYGFKGTIDEVRIYDRALSKEEINELYNLEKPKSPLDKGLVAYYPFNGNAKDESGNGNHGEVNGPKLAADRHGKPNSAYSFDGTDDFIDLGDKDVFDIKKNDLTISIHFQCEGTQNNRYLIGKYHYQNYPAYGVGTHVLGGGYVFFGQTPPVEVNGNVNLSDGNWHHMVVVFDRDSKLTIYLDGAFSASGNISHQSGDISNAVKLFIGKISSGEHFGGKIDDIRIYNRALSAGEVKKLFDLEKP